MSLLWFKKKKNPSCTPAHSQTWIINAVTVRAAVVLRSLDFILLKVMCTSHPKCLSPQGKWVCCHGHEKCRSGNERCQHCVINAWSSGYTAQLHIAWQSPCELFAFYTSVSPSVESILQMFLNKNTIVMAQAVVLLRQAHGITWNILSKPFQVGGAIKIIIT